MKKISKFLGLCFLAIVTSCSAPKNVVYMQDLTPENPMQVPPVQYLRIKPQDKLRINVHCRDENIASLFNVRGHGSYIGGGYGGSSGGSLDLYTYNVDEMGNIEFPVVGMVHVAGLTRQEAADEIRNILIEQNLVKDPYVSCSFATAYFYTLGEMGKGQVQIPKDAFTIIEAISQAGDLPLTGDRTNIQVIRKVGEKLQTYEVDLTSAESIVMSPVYYIQPNDIIYVRPTKKQQFSTSAVGSSILTPSFWMGMISSVISLSLTIYTLGGRFK